jgi:hypothetical protein
VSFSSANIPTVSFAITADLPSRCHQRNQADGFEGLSAGHKPDPRAQLVPPNPCQAFDLLIKALLQIIRNCK